MCASSECWLNLGVGEGNDIKLAATHIRPSNNTAEIFSVKETGCPSHFWN
jgi:hypothetical protein